MTLLLSMAIVLIFTNTPVAALQDHNAKLAWKAIGNYLSWQNYWYGGFYGGKCYDKYVGKTVTVNFTYFTALEAFSHISHTYECDSSKRKYVQSGNFGVYIKQVDLAFIVDGLPEVYGLTNKPRPYLTIQDIDCSQPKYKADKFNPRLWDISYVERIRLPKIEQHELPLLENNLQNKTVLAAVMRSMRCFLANEIVEAKRDGSFKNYSGNLKGDNNKILLGRFRDDDPYLLVYYKGNNKVYILDFLPNELLLNPDLCMTAYSAIPNSGNDNVSLPYDMSPLIERLKRNSIELSLDAPAII